MRMLWTFFKVAIVLAIAIPLGLIAMGVVFGLARLAFRVAVLGLIGWGIYRLARALFGFNTPPTPAPAVSLPTPDPYYTAAMRELDAEIGNAR